MTLIMKHFDNIAGKGGNADNQHFLLFPECCLPKSKPAISFHQHLKKFKLASVKAIADDKLYVTELTSFALEVVENIVGQAKCRLLWAQFTA